MLNKVKRGSFLVLPSLFVISLTSFALAAPPPGKGGGNGGGGDGNVSANYAFVFQDNGGLSLTTIDDSQRMELTQPGGTEHDNSPIYSPDLSPDIEDYQGMIAFLRRNDDGINQIYVTDADGANSMIVSEYLYPADSPSGTRDGYAVQQCLAWSPSGLELLYAANDGGLWVVDVLSGSRYCALEYHTIMEISISAVRQQISFVGGGRVWTVDFTLDSGGFLHIDPLSRKILLDQPYARYPKFSPDGQFLAFTNYENGAELRVRELSNLTEMTLFVDLSIGESAWSPDGLEIACEVTRDDGKGRASLDIARITNWWDADSRRLHFVTQTGGGRKNEMQPEWNPAYSTSP